MARPKKQVVTIKSDEKNPEPLEIIAKSIIEVSRGFQRMNESRLKRRVIVLLLHDMTGTPINHINTILDAAPKLEEHFTKVANNKKS